MILITVTTAGAEAIVCGIRYQARSSIMESAVRSVINQIANYNDDQEVLIEWPTVVARHRSLWRLAGIKTKDGRTRR